MSPLIIAIFCLAIAQQSHCNDEMNANTDPILEFLQLNGKSPPEHELVNIDVSERLHKRSFSETTMPTGTRMQIQVFGDNIDLWLQPRDSILFTEETPVYYSKYSPGRPGNVSILRQYGLMSVVGRVYEDPEYLASLVIGTDGRGRTTVNGRIESKNLVVRSLPEEVVNDYVIKRNSIDHPVNVFSNSTYHVIYRSNDELEEFYVNGAINETMLRGNNDQTNAEVPYTIHPKILLFADYSIYKGQAYDVYGFVEYLLAFWNGVDLKYRVLESPRVRLHISAIVIGMDNQAAQFISNVMLSDNAFNAGQAMIDAKSFFYQIRRSIPLEIYDIAFTMTRLRFGLTGGVIGMAWTGTTCRNSSKWERMDAVAIGQDNGAFSGVHTAAHELGHLLGMGHDTDKIKNCMYNNGFIMSFTPWFTKNSSSFSHCSLRDIQKQLDDRKLECMYRTPRVNGKIMPKLMPGRVMSLEQQCSAYDLGLPCRSPDVDICVNIHCRQSDGVCTKTGIAAHDGTPCNDRNDEFDRYCIHHECVRV